MSGRKQPKVTEAEKRREYRVWQKRARGEVEEPEAGPVGEVARERAEWARRHEAVGRGGEE